MEERLVHCLEVALRNHVTDIHFSLKEDGTVLIEMRVNGVIRQLKQQEDERFFRYLQYRANLDVSNAMLPQTGRFEAEVDGRKLALRFALLSSYHVTSGVLRILNNHESLTISSLTCDPEAVKWMEQITSHRSGLILFVGPTGSGKTSSLYTILDATVGKKIYTLEDPVEVFSEKYVQIQINEKQQMGYAEGIRQLMRHDPDIIMIGEIRDQIAAQMAVRCALTGHLVLSSLHSSSCINAIERMLDLQVSRAQLQDVLCGISNQRLYDTADSRKIGVYEIMDREEVRYYFSHERTSSRFITLQKQIARAVAAGVVDSAQAAQDID
jgi:competence protein ComGA